MLRLEQRSHQRFVDPHLGGRTGHDSVNHTSPQGEVHDVRCTRSVTARESASTANTTLPYTEPPSSRSAAVEGLRHEHGVLRVAMLTAGAAERRQHQRPRDAVEGPRLGTGMEHDHGRWPSRSGGSTAAAC